MLTPSFILTKEEEGKVLRLWKAMYGLKQSPPMWNKHVDKTLVEFGMHRLSADLCVYAMHDREKRVLLGLFVDDMFLIVAIMQCINMLKSML